MDEIRKSFEEWARGKSFNLDMDLNPFLDSDTHLAFDIWIAAIKSQAFLLHNLSVIENELKQIDETECSKQAWDRVLLALEFAAIAECK